MFSDLISGVWCLDTDVLISVCSLSSLPTAYLSEGHPTTSLPYLLPTPQKCYLQLVKLNIYYFVENTGVAESEIWL